MVILLGLIGGFILFETYKSKPPKGYATFAGLTNGPQWQAIFHVTNLASLGPNVVYQVHPNNLQPGRARDRFEMGLFHPLRPSSRLPGFEQIVVGVPDTGDQFQLKVFIQHPTLGFNLYNMAARLGIGSYFPVPRNPFRTIDRAHPDIVSPWVPNPYWTNEVRSQVDGDKSPSAKR